jgi:RNA polymerase sigma factor (sigma-70 family)
MNCKGKEIDFQTMGEYFFFSRSVSQHHKYIVSDTEAVHQGVSMYNPFCEKKAEHENDIKLIHRVLEGSREDLEKLVFRHQAWIYNIALKMVLDPVDAEDVTQEILIKLITKLATYDPDKGAFRTWLYRIVANHVFNMKTSKYERIFRSMDDHIEAIRKTPDQTISASPENSLLLEELKIKCLTAILLCLDRRHRLVFILGEIFDVADQVGSEILEISRINFRKMLSRSRKKISNFMTQNCGLINESNPCNCARKLKGYMDQGFVRQDHLSFYKSKAKQIIDMVETDNNAMDREWFTNITELFRSHPFYEIPDFKTWYQDIITDDAFRDIIHKDFH